MFLVVVGCGVRGAGLKRRTEIYGMLRNATENGFKTLNRKVESTQHPFLSPAAGFHLTRGTTDGRKDVCCAGANSCAVRTQVVKTPITWECLHPPHMLLSSVRFEDDNRGASALGQTRHVSYARVIIVPATAISKNLPWAIDCHNDDCMRPTNRRAYLAHCKNVAGKASERDGGYTRKSVSAARFAAPQACPNPRTAARSSPMGTPR